MARKGNGPIRSRPARGGSKSGGEWVPASPPIAGYGGTSTTSVTIGLGSKVFTTQAGMAYAGGRVRASVATDTTKWLEGDAVYGASTMTIASDVFAGAGTYANWVFSVAGSRGATGAPGAGGATGAPGAAGEKWFTATGAPGSVAGAINGDWYLNSTNGDYYELVAAVWTLRGNLKGPQGVAGPPGASGSGSGDVTGPGVAVVNDELAAFNGTTGTAIKSERQENFRSCADLGAAGAGDRRAAH